MSVSFSSTLFWCKLTRIPRVHNTVLVFFYPIQIRIVSGSHYCGVNVHHVGVTFTLNWCSHSCKNLHFFGVTITLALFLCENSSYVSRDDFKVASSKLKYFSCNSKKRGRARGPLVRECCPWSENHVNSKKSTCESQ